MIATKPNDNPVDGNNLSAEDRFIRHKGPVTCVAAVPNSTVAVTSAYDGAVGLFDMSNGSVELLGYHNHLVNRIVVNDAGTKAASCSSDYMIFIWDLRFRRLEQVLRGHSDDVEDFVFVTDKVGISCSRDHRLLIWDLQTGAILRFIDEHEKDVLSVAYHDGKIYSSGDDKTLRQWSLTTGQLISMWGPFEQETDTCTIDPLHKRAILGCDDGFIRIFDIESGSLIHEISAHKSGIKKVAVSPRDGDLLSAAYDRRIRIWDADSLEPKFDLESAQTVWERSLNWSPDGKLILAGTFDGTVLVWNASDGQRIMEIGDQATGNACFNDVAASSGGDFVAVSDNGRIRLGRLTTGEAIWLNETEPAGGRMLMNAATLDDAYGMVVTGAHNHKLHIFDKAGDSLQNEVAVYLGNGPINTVRISHHTRYEEQLFVGCYGGTIFRVTRSGEVAGTIRVHEGAIKSLRLHPAEPFGVSCGADNLLLSWGFEGELLERYLGHTAIIDDVDISPAGERIASTGRDFTLKLYEFFTGKLLYSILLGHRSPKSICYFDEERVIIGDYWGTIIKFDLTTSRVSRRQIASNGISALSRSGENIIACSYDGGVYLVCPDDLRVINKIQAMKQKLAAASIA
jgi:WD40 repeat protein